MNENRHTTMSVYTMAIPMALLGFMSPGLAAESTSQATTSTMTASQPSRADNPKVDNILNRLEKKGDDIKSIEADIEFVKVDPVLEDRQEYKGILFFKQGKPNPKFFIRFDQLKQEGTVRNQKIWHVFDGQWYAETRDNSNVITKRQIVRPGEHVEVFKLGQGPFPLPFGQKKAEILKHFDVKLVPPDLKDPPHTDHLACTPRPTSDLGKRYDTVHFYIDQTLDLPVRIQTTEKEEGNQVIASFPSSSIKVNSGVADSQFELPSMPDKIVDSIPLDDQSMQADKQPDKKP